MAKAYIRTCEECGNPHTYCKEDVDGLMICADCIEAEKLEEAMIENSEGFPVMSERDFHNTVNRLSAEKACRDYFGIGARDPFPVDCMAHANAIKATLS